MTPSLVQMHAIPLVLQGKDLLCRARTGSGKTAAYLLPMLHKILRRKALEGSGGGGMLITSPRALVLVPTNELCHQVERQLAELMYYCNDVISTLSLAPAAAGEGRKASRSKSAVLKAQAVLLQSCPDIIIATPARAQMHLSKNNLQLEAPNFGACLPQAPPLTPLPSTSHQHPPTFESISARNHHHHPRRVTSLFPTVSQSFCPPSFCPPSACLPGRLTTWPPPCL